MKTLLVSLITSLIMTATTNVHDIALKTLTGEDIKLSQFKGKKILIVNTASKCGYTSQYEDLQKLHAQYGAKIAVVGMPCNQFMGQEPGDANEIAAFCKKNYGVTFTMLEKADVKGKNQHPLYNWLCNKSENGVADARVGWNFHKFLIDENGKLLADFGSSVNPLDEKIISHLK